MTGYSVVCSHGRFTERHCEDCQEEAERVPEITRRAKKAERQRDAALDVLRRVRLWTRMAAAVKVSGAAEVDAIVAAALEES